MVREIFFDDCIRIKVINPIHLENDLKIMP